ncbi:MULTISPECIES: TA system VapC family ribonuclease toxin [unclassified Acidovorax]|uniref:TA system VapC family ribonuclease toxin n=1 Tax=unclassified Acidovorax TaxID=2684926 RepID=UPI000BC83954|nr:MULTISPECIES: TA system VapC family ribonuclease toxin [unclassified Acidovorax]HQS22725.1 PIN domain-containing protein [Acidovorax defluvii]OYY82478.1 MAG: VapC toxin family PIN domain ribonuclease [Acidovorax sp. 28-64-14]OYZ65748.1 MAG: VapC toxin family PIN domain ribonuclease [Acidovorax sp. 24-64-9]OZA66795.1 MAG: VapC toxin family PIN domain ribonuclease [Acidovorax sp. 39-64-12]HQS65381.1 PIN domain-containing protein [Acidovorax defluvii]
MRALLDINVLIALLDAAHIHHQRASQWLEQSLHHGWASCPLTQNGCLRIMAQPAYPQALPLAAVAQRLGQAAATPAHLFIADDYSLLDADSLHWPQLLGHRQVTDAYLLGLAVRHGCRFVSFDARVNLAAVPGAKAEHLWVL